MSVSLGVAGTLGPDLIAQLAPHVEAAGFATLWVNDTPRGDALAALAAAARTTSRLRLGTGVIPLDRRPAASLGPQIAQAGIPEDRLVLGIGSGAGRVGALDRVRDGIRDLRAHTRARIVVGALGPRMRRVGAERADGVLLNWVTAPVAAAQAREAHEIAPDAHVAVYIRTALDAPGAARLEAEAERYAGVPAYAANFARMRVDAIQTTFPDGAALRAGLPAYVEAVDEVVLRAVPAHDDLDAYRAFVAATAPLG